MVVLMEDIMLEIELHKRFYNQVFIGIPFLKMLESLFYLMMNALCGGDDVNHHPVGNPKRKV
jgi:hypothetical protein